MGTAVDAALVEAVEAICKLAMAIDLPLDVVSNTEIDRDGALGFQIHNLHVFVYFYFRLWRHDWRRSADSGGSGRKRVFGRK